MVVDTAIATNVLRQIPLFASLTDEQMAGTSEWLNERSTYVSLESGETLYAEGEVASTFCVLLEGELQITKRVNGQEIVLSNAHPGDFMGEVALLLRTPCGETVRAVRASRLLRVNGDDFLAAMSPVGSVMLS